jgi:NTP pyrophosphatase (non-canonical NTP hydrolase)
VPTALNHDIPDFKEVEDHKKAKETTMKGLLEETITQVEKHIEIKEDSKHWSEQELDKIRQTIINFRDERNWKPCHNEKDLAISISLEANELLENFQWKTSEEAVKDSKQNIKEEMADILIYLVQLADKLDIDLEEEVLEKMKKNALKYPVHKG